MLFLKPYTIEIGYIDIQETKKKKIIHYKFITDSQNVKKKKRNLCVVNCDLT